MTSFTTQISDGIARLELNLPREPVNKVSRAVILLLLLSVYVRDYVNMFASTAQLIEGPLAEGTESHLC